MNELFLKILNMSLSASWLIPAVLILRLTFEKAPKWANVLLWGIVAVRLLCPFSIESPFSLIPESIGNGEFVSEWMDDYTGREPIPSDGGGHYVVTDSDWLSEPSTVGNTKLPIWTAAWIAGMILLALYTTISYLRLRRKMDTAVWYRGNIFQSEHVSTPFVLGIFHPRIYLPFKMDEQNMEYVVAHEKAHIHRKDHWWKPLGFLLLTIHWFNPLIWLAYVMLCRDIELACDEKVIKGLNNEKRADYTQALVACSVNRHVVTACPLAFGEVGVKKRVESVLNFKKPTFLGIALTVMVCTVVAVCFITNPKEPSAHDILTRNGYTILEQKQVPLTLTISKSQLPDTIYTKEGAYFEEEEVVAYRTDTTTIYLHSAMISNESDEQLYLVFDCSFDLPKCGSFITPTYVHIERDSYGSKLNLRSEDLTDGKNIFTNTLHMRGWGPGSMFYFYVSKDALRSAEGNIMIDIECNQVSYAKKDYEWESFQLLSSDDSDQ